MMRLTRSSAIGWGMLALSALLGGCSNGSDEGHSDDDDSDSKAAVDGGTDGDTDIDTEGGGGDRFSERPDDFEVSVHLASEERPEAPGTVGIVTWSVEGFSVDRAEIRFGLDKKYGMTAPVDLDKPSNRTLLLGMKPRRTYHFQVVAAGEGVQYGSGDYTVETGPVTNLVSPIQTVSDDDGIASGFIITESMTNFDSSTGSVVYILDRDGDVVWWFRNDIGRTSRALMSYDGRAIWMVPDTGNYDGGPIQVVSMDTLQTEIFNAGSSHDLTIVDKNTIGYIEFAEEDCGSVFELTTDGAMKEVFELSDVYPELSPPECHLNALHYYEDLDVYTVSDRSNDVFIIDRQGDIQWRLSEHVSNALWNREQHGHQLLSDSLLIFANSGGENFESSAVLELDLEDGTERFRYDPGISSVWLGDVERLANDNLLVTFSIAGVIHEIDSSGKRVREITENTIGYASWRPSLYGPPYHI